MVAKKKSRSGAPTKRPNVRRVRVKMNGSFIESEIEPRLLLADFIRDVANLTGTHIGCETSNCGACTVLVDGESVKSCTMFAVQADGRSVRTIEGLAADRDDGEGAIAPDGNGLHAIQQAFWENHGLQCGFCTPGIIMQAYWLLKENPNPTEAEVRAGISGNLCRCTGYVNIVKSIRAAAEEMMNDGPAAVRGRR